MMMARQVAVGLGLVAFAVAASTAQAQVTSVSATQNRVHVAFTGTVTNDVTNTIMIRQPNGTATPYTGPVPDYPYKKGDQVTISFDVLAPNKAFFDSPAYTGQRSVDSYYDIDLVQGVFNPGANGAVGTVDITGPARQEPFPNSVSGIKLAYHADTDTYLIRSDTAAFTIDGLDTPSYGYDRNTGALTNSNTACFGPVCEQSGILARGNIDFNTGQVGVRIENGNPAYFGASQRGIQIGDANENGGIAGFFSALGLSGVFNMPMIQRTPTNVPEPGMMLLFGGGASALLARRRKRKPQAA